ncbi:MAG TPA: hypothetical protein VHD34_08760 [Xanthobacteraceae bacterium]|nr:hypothetical protein [Xanthobacteraceae bacterium]
MSLSGLSPAQGVRAFAASSPAEGLRAFAIAAGLISALLFIVVGLHYALQMYADGSIFSYAVAVRDVWAFHWHNISGRASVYLLAMAPAEIYVRLTGDPHGGIEVYGFLFFSAQLLGLLATFRLDRSRGRILFTYACLSTACLCPLVFGFPTEMWIAHALFWPTLALSHYGRKNILSVALLFPMVLAMMLSHEGALIYAVIILLTLLLRGANDPAFLRSLGVFALALAIWFWVKADIRPDSYIAPVLERAAFEVFSIDILTGSLMRLLYTTLALYAIAFAAAYRFTKTKAHLCAAALVAVLLAIFWLTVDHSLHAEQRYYMRTIVLSAAPGFALLAAFYALLREDCLAYRLPLQHYLIAARSNDIVYRLIGGAFFLVLLVHTVETAKFVTAWTNYTAAIRNLAMSSISDPALGDPRFVSSNRVPKKLQRLEWFSTTPYLSALVAPNFTPNRLVVDPEDNYFWLSCKTATRSAKGKRAFPAAPRELVRIYSCQHRS